MKLSSLCAALVLLLAFAATGRADEFSDIQNNPHTYWAPAPNVYGGAPDPYSYYGSPPPVIFYGPPPPPPPAFFIHFSFHH